MGDASVEALRERAAAALFPLEGDLRVPGLTAPVTVTRDGYGRPTIDASSIDDLWFAQGVVTAGERLFQLDLSLRAANGRLSEVFGERMVDADRFVRTIGLHVAGRRHLERWTDEDHAMHARFRAGVLAWCAAMPAAPVEYQLLDLQPELPDDPAAWASCFAYLAWGLSNNWDRELLRHRIRAAAGDEAVRVLVPPNAGAAPLGSNNWALAGSRTVTGVPMLANDPHLLALQPGAWLECRLRAPGYDVRGVAVAFSPGVIIGATPHHAWGLTNVTGDVQDLYLDPAVTGTREERIAVRGEPDARIVTVEETRHGPILTHEPVGLLQPTYRPLEERVALRWTGHEFGIRPSLALGAARARSFQEFQAAVLEVGCPGQNFVYADVDGAIGLQVTGVHPVRRSGDGTEPVESSSGDWDGWVPAEAMPSVADPPGGVIVTANDARHAGSAPYLISMDFHEPFRAVRIDELLAERELHDVASLAAIQVDTVSIPARETVPLLCALVMPDERRRLAVDALAGWDGDMRADSVPAALFHAWSDAIGRRVVTRRLGEALADDYLAWRETWRSAVLPRLLRERPDGWLDDDLLEAALGDALEALGDPMPTWGDLHRLVLAHPLAAIPGLEPLFVAADVPIGGDEQTVAQSGSDGRLGHRAAVIASWRVVWDLADLDRSVSVLPNGISGNPASPHWSDQVDEYAKGGAHPAGPPVATLTMRPA
jgi:penicillin G amidase